METYRFIQSGDKYTVLDAAKDSPIEIEIKHPQRKFLAKEVNLEDLILGLEFIYERMQDPANNNPDDILKSKGINVDWVSYDDDSKARIVYNLCQYLNKLHGRIVGHIDGEERLRARLDEVKRLVG